MSFTAKMKREYVMNTWLLGGHSKKPLWKQLAEQTSNTKEFTWKSNKGKLN